MLLYNKFDLIRAISQVLDLLNATLVGHHLRTAFLADQLGRRLALKPKDNHLVVLSAMLHDLGVVPLGLKPDDLLFEKDMDSHSRAGWLLLRTCPQLLEESWLVRYHHFSWTAVQHLPERSRRLGELANLIHLADYLDISIRTGLSPRQLRGALKDQAGRIFSPDYVEAARDLLFTPDLFQNLSEAARYLALPPTADLALTEDDSMAFAHLFARIIDSRSRFTALHSITVASLGLLLHQLAGGREEDVQPMYLAGLLHDVGKLGVPLELIEKEDRLTPSEFDQVSQHAELSYQTLSSLPSFQRVAVWGACHHERLDGSGYPRGLMADNLPLESRIVAVADVLAALTEQRPYRPALPARQALGVLESMAQSGLLDGELVGIIHENLSMFSLLRRDVHDENQVFLQKLASDLDLFAQNRVSTAELNPLRAYSPPG